MPSREVTRSNYRKARCCGNCRREDKRHCGLHGMPVSQDMICDNHEEDPNRASSRVRCGECRYGLTGDHSCSDGCREKIPDDAGCYAGRKR